MKKITFLLAFLCVAVLATAQQFELRVQAMDDGNLAVQMRETQGLTPSTDDLIGDLTFGLLWNTSNCNNASTIEISVEESDYNIIPAMAKFTKSGDLIQAFRVSTAPFAIPQDWAIGEFVTVAVLKASSSASCPLELTEVNHESPQHNDLLVATEPNITIAYSDDMIGRDFRPNITSSTMVNTLETLAADRLQAFPNPAKELLNVRFDSATNGKASVRIYNVVGKLMHQAEMEMTAGQNAFTINGAKFPKGTYLLNIISENTQVSQKVAFVD